jgi:hypothetical protein
MVNNSLIQLIGQSNDLATAVGYGAPVRLHNGTWNDSVAAAWQQQQEDRPIARAERSNSVAAFRVSLGNCFQNPDEQSAGP